MVKVSAIIETLTKYYKNSHVLGDEIIVTFEKKKTKFYNIVCDIRGRVWVVF